MSRRKQSTHPFSPARKIPPSETTSYSGKIYMEAQQKKGLWGSRIILLVETFKTLS